jgi:CRP/FNR family transcriptional regulator, cyclic AMP receptor protein
MIKEANILQYLKKIKTVQIFHWLNEDELQKILLISSILHFNKGEVIIAQDEVGDALYALVSGEAIISIRDLKGQSVNICTIQPGESFGEAAIFMAAKRTATVMADADTTVIQTNRKDLIYFFRNYPHAGNKLLMLMILNLLNKLKHANEDLILEKQSDVDLAYVDSLIHDFITQCK